MTRQRAERMVPGPYRTTPIAYDGGSAQKEITVGVIGPQIESGVTA
ncbi:MAG: hypothetical protein WD049_04120 [Candidatus Paceibacterota bacterium]